MSNVPVQVIVAAFATPDRAGQLMADLKAGRKEGLIGIVDAAVVVKDADGKLKVTDAKRRSTKGFVTGGLIGGVIGLLAGPVGWAALGGGAIGALIGKLRGAPLRRPDGQVDGNSPLMGSLLFIITLFFLVAGIAFGRAVGTIKSSGDAIKFATAQFNTMGGLVLMFLMISQFIALFNYTNLPTVIAVNLAGLLERLAVGAIPLLILLILVNVLIDVIMPGSVPGWAIFAPIFVPLFLRLGVEPSSVLAAYRIGDSPVNPITPLMVYLPFILTIAQRYQKSAGLGTVISLMVPYTVIILIAWIALFVIWFALNIPLGPGYFPQLATP